jgi:hypothetical protein
MDRLRVFIEAELFGEAGCKSVDWKPPLLGNDFSEKLNSSAAKVSLWATCSLTYNTPILIGMTPALMAT